MGQCDVLRAQAREKLQLAARATDRATKQGLAEAAFKMAQEAEAQERAEQDARRPRVLGGRYD